MLECLTMNLLWIIFAPTVVKTNDPYILSFINRDPTKWDMIFRKPVHTNVWHFCGTEKCRCDFSLSIICHLVKLINKTVRLQSLLLQKCRRFFAYHGLSFLIGFVKKESCSCCFLPNIYWWCSCARWKYKTYYTYINVIVSDGLLLPRLSHGHQIINCNVSLLPWFIKRRTLLKSSKQFSL